MTLIQFKLAAALLFFVSALLGGAWPFFARAKQSNSARVWQESNLACFAENFTKGLLLGVALFDLLPSSVKSFLSLSFSSSFAYLIAGISVIILAFIKYLGSNIHFFHSHYNSSSYVVTLLLAIHAFLEGSALGLASNHYIVLALAISILLHKGVIAFALAIIINKSKLSLLSSSLLFLSFACMSPIGILCGNELTALHNNLLQALFNAFAAAILIYISLFHELEPLSAEHKKGIKNWLFMLSGFVFVAIISK